MTFNNALISVGAPCAVLLAAWYLLPATAGMPDTLSGLQVYGAPAVFFIAAAVSMAFRRGRVLMAVLLLAIAYGCYVALLAPAPRAFPSRAVALGLGIFVPLNLALLAWSRERGIFNLYGLRRLALAAAQIALTAWIALASQTGLVSRLQRPLFGSTPLTTAVSDLELAVAIAAAGVTFACWWRTRSPVDIGLAGVLAAFVLAGLHLRTPHAYAQFAAAGGLILVIAVLQDSFRMAFRDGLTGLPSRRALDEALASLGRGYTIAMLDVDHFKNFNDTYGHDVGDQVLKMVAARLTRVSGGGSAYRYGGEEFTVLFKGRTAREAWPHVEALREDIGERALALRAADRPREAKSGRRRRGSKERPERSVSVTVSIGVAEEGGKLTTPSAVIAAADRALYRAKRKGRNRVSR